MQNKKSIWRTLYNQRVLLLMMLPGILWYIIFKYATYSGLFLAFTNYGFKDVVSFVGLRNFRRLFKSAAFWNAFRNTLIISICNIIFYFPFPLIIGPRLAKVEREGTVCRVQRALFFHCYMEGDVDFIFGCGCAYFDQCIFFSRYSPCPQGETDHSQKKEDRDRSIAGYVTAAATPRGQRYGFVMNDCRFEGDCPEKSVFLGRPWRNYARCVITLLPGCTHRRLARLGEKRGEKDSFFCYLSVQRTGGIPHAGMGSGAGSRGSGGLCERNCAGSGFIKDTVC